MVDITKVICDSSQSLEKLRQYLQKSNVVLVACRKVSVSSCATDRPLETLPIDTVKGREESAREPVPAGYFDLDDGSSSAYWNLNSTLNVKKFLKQKGISPIACNRHCDVRIKRTNTAEGGQEAPYLGTVLRLSFDRYHSDSQSGILLCSQSNLLRDGRWVDLLVRYLKSIFVEAPLVWILWVDSNNPSHTEFRKVV